MILQKTKFFFTKKQKELQNNRKHYINEITENITGVKALQNYRKHYNIFTSIQYKESYKGNKRKP